jgi:hypothetical protein
MSDYRPIHSSILRRVCLNFTRMCLGYFSFQAGAAVLELHIFISDFQLFWPEHHLCNFISGNAHLVHQSWYRFSFTFNSTFTYTKNYNVLFQSDNQSIYPRIRNKSSASV